MSPEFSKKLGVALVFITSLIDSAPVAGAIDDSNPLADPEEVYAERLMEADVQHVLRLLPKAVTNLYEPPDGWQTLRFDSIELKLPLGTSWFVFQTNTLPNFLLLSAFNASTNYFSLSSLGPYSQPDISYPPTSFEDQSKVLNTTPDDVSRADSEERKREIVTCLLAKAALQPDYVREWIAVQTPDLRALVLRSPMNQNGYGSIHINVWNRKGTVYFDLMAVRETSPFMAQQILGGIKFHGDLISSERVHADIEQLAAKHIGPAKGSVEPAN